MERIWESDGWEYYNEQGTEGTRVKVELAPALHLQRPGSRLVPAYDRPGVSVFVLDGDLE